MAEEKAAKEVAKEAKQHEHKSSQQNVASIVRLSGKDINGALNIRRSLQLVKGVGSNLSYVLSNIVETKLGIPLTTNVGSLSEEQVLKVEDVIKYPHKYGVPTYMLNRSNDMESGNPTLHNTGNELIFSTRQDVNRDITLKDWRGLRHQYGQRVRGQHTRSTGRTGATVGVTKKAVKDAQKAARASPAAAPAGAGGAASAKPAAEAKK
jgi:small subunit ribosomal protein S13